MIMRLWSNACGARLQMTWNSVVAPTNMRKIAVRLPWATISETSPPESSYQRPNDASEPRSASSVNQRQLRTVESASTARSTTTTYAMVSIPARPPISRGSGRSPKAPRTNGAVNAPMMPITASATALYLSADMAAVALIRNSSPVAK